MHSERYSPELEGAFETWVRAKGITVALFDLDDTLIDTSTLFIRHEHAFFDFCRQFIDETTIEDLKVRYKEVNTATFGIMGASPQRWEHIINELSVMYRNENIRSGLYHLQEVYTHVPEQFEGAVETLDIFKRTGIRMGLVTHATQEWTDLKVDQLGIRDYFERIKVIDVDEHRFKATQHWQEVVQDFDVDPRQVIAIGDNVRGDIEAAYGAGIRNLALLPSGWHVYSEGDLPEKVTVVDKIGNLIPTLLSQ